MAPVAHAGRAAVADPDQPGLLEPLERLPHRVAARAELLGQPPLGRHGGAGREGAGEDVGAEPGVDAIGQEHWLDQLEDWLYQIRVASSSAMIEAGTTAPDFTLPDQEGDDVSLSDFRGKPVVLYFYPKADTPGCTTQACGIRDHRADYDAAGAVVLGVSPDPVKAVKKFADKQSLNFRLLADEDHAVCDTYGVWAEKSMYGRTYWGALRSTFIIDPDGTVAHVIPKASPKTHDDEVLKALGELAAA